MTNNRTFWTAKDIEYLKNNYAHFNKEDIINDIGKTWKSIGLKASRLGISRYEP